MAGSQSDRAGTKVTSINTVAQTSQNGQIVFSARVIGMPPMALPTNSTDPTGGVIRPMPQFSSRAFHTVDILLAFDNVAAAGSRVAGADAQTVADRLSDAFIAFARSGDPNHPGLPAWRPYGLTDRETMVLDVETRLENDPRGAERRFFALTPYVQPGT